MKHSVLLKGLLFLMMLPVLILARPGKGMGDGPGQRDGEGFRKGGHIEKLKEEINLTDDQVKKMEKIRLRSHGAIEDLQHEMKKVKRELLEKSIDNKVSKSDIKTVLGKIEKLRGKIGEIRLNSISNIVDLLTDDQIKLMTEKKMLGKMLQFRKDDRDFEGKGKKCSGKCEKPGKCKKDKH